ncbi:MAG: VTT domain-containing protein [Dehalococcoidales bacterium]|nr:VTT domain-containing protein [Dehalococcoidales bacterium]
MQEKAPLKKKLPTRAIWLILVGSTLAICILLIVYWRYLSQFQWLVFLGLFFTAILAGSPIPVPTPCMWLTFTLGSAFEPVIIGLIASTGAAIGSLLVYFTARTGRRFFPSLNISDPANQVPVGWFTRFLRKIKFPRLLAFVNRRGVVGLFLFAILPNPLLMPLLVTMGIARVRIWKVSLAVWLGHSVLFLTLAYLGHFGLGSIIQHFGLFKVP